jgi:hypothetical protein
MDEELWNYLMKSFHLVPWLPKAHIGNYRIPSNIGICRPHGYTLEAQDVIRQDYSEARRGKKLLDSRLGKEFEREEFPG